MNPTEEFSNLQNTSEHFRNVQQPSEDFSNVQNNSKRAGGVGRGKKYPGAEIPDHDYDRDDFIIMEEVYALFEHQGERRSVRMIAEYCKTGELVCTYDSDDKRWHITRESVQNKIDKIKALNARKGQSNTPQHQQPASEDFTAPPRTAEDAHQKEGHNTELEQSIKKFELELLDLKITNRGKDYFIEQLQKERDTFITKIESNSLLIGELKTKLLQLEAPSRDRNSTARPVAWRDAESTQPHAGTSLSANDNNKDYESPTLHPTSEAEDTLVQS